MPRTKGTPPRRSKPAKAAPAHGPTEDVMTLPEAAAYLRLAEADVLRLVAEQDLPGRQLGSEWRFLKSAIQAWLGTPRTRAKHREGIWGAAGALKDDHYLEAILKEIDRMRGRAASEEG